MNKNDKVAAFFSQFSPVKYGPKEIIISAEITPKGILYISEGFVRQYFIATSGNEITFHFFTPGSFIPLTWAINDNSNHYYYEAFTQVRGYLAPKEKVLKFIGSDSEILNDLVKRLLSGISGLLKRIEQLTTEDANGRLISILIFLTSHFGQFLNGQVTLTYKFTHQDLANLIGTSRETVSRELEKLIRARLIKYQNHFIIIPDLKNLKEYEI